uniref:MalT-like TPR region domain-containing protein n=1 Tax=Bionectria ochroleuca TaxID=29856 RepID=A0A8H7K126_BIOOC
MNRTSFARYLSDYHESEEGMMELLGNGFDDDTHHNRSQSAVATTWLVSFKQPKAIPRSILPDMGSEQAKTQVIGTLEGYGFLTTREGGDILDMHSLVHTIAQRQVRSQGVSKLGRDRIFSHLYAVFPDGKWRDRYLWQQYLPHALQAYHSLSEDEPSDSTGLGYKMACCFIREGRYPEAIAILERVVIVQRRLEEDNSENLLERIIASQSRFLPNDHPDQLTSQERLAEAYNFKRQPAPAISILEYTTAIRSKSLPENDNRLLTSQYLLAQAYTEGGRTDKALEILEHIVAIRSRSLPEDNPARLASQHQLALAYRANLQTSKAISLLEHITAVEARCLPQDHQAIEILELVVDIRSRYLPEDHRDRLRSECDLATAYSYTHDDRTKEATNILEHAVAVGSWCFAEDDTYLLVLQYALAREYGLHGRLKEAIEVMEHVVATESYCREENDGRRLASEKLLSQLREDYHSRARKLGDRIRGSLVRPLIRAFQRQRRSNDMADQREVNKALSSALHQRTSLRLFIRQET